MNDGFRYALDAAVGHFLPQEFARKPASGQLGFNFEEDHPREKSAHDGKEPGEFAPKPESNPSTPVDKMEHPADTAPVAPDVGAEKKSGAEATVTHEQLGQMVSQIVRKSEGFVGKVVTHRDGTVRVYLKEDKGKKGWIERGEATINPDGALEMDSKFQHAFFYDKPILEELRSLPVASPRDIVQQYAPAFHNDREESPDDPIERMEWLKNRGIGGGKAGDE